MSRSPDKAFIEEFIRYFRRLPALWNNRRRVYYDIDKKKKSFVLLLFKYREVCPMATIQDVQILARNLCIDFQDTYTTYIDYDIRDRRRGKAVFMIHKERSNALCVNMEFIQLAIDYGRERVTPEYHNYTPIIVPLPVVHGNIQSLDLRMPSLRYGMSPRTSREPIIAPSSQSQYWAEHLRAYLGLEQEALYTDRSPTRDYSMALDLQSIRIDPRIAETPTVTEYEPFTPHTEGYSIPVESPPSRRPIWTIESILKEDPPTVNRPWAVRDIPGPTAGFDFKPPSPVKIPRPTPRVIHKGSPLKKHILHKYQLEKSVTNQTEGSIRYAGMSLAQYLRHSVPVTCTVTSGQLTDPVSTGMREVDSQAQGSDDGDSQTVRDETLAVGTDSIPEDTLSSVLRGSESPGFEKAVSLSPLGWVWEYAGGSRDSVTSRSADSPGLVSPPYASLQATPEPNIEDFEDPRAEHVFVMPGGDQPTDAIDPGTAADAVCVGISDEETRAAENSIKRELERWRRTQSESPPS